MQDITKTVEHKVKQVQTTFSVEYKGVELTVKVDKRNGKVQISPKNGNSRDGFVFHGSDPQTVTNVARALILAMAELKKV